MGHVIDAVLLPPSHSPTPGPTPKPTPKPTPAPPSPPSPPSPSTCNAGVLVDTNCDDGKNLGAPKPMKTQDGCCSYCKETKGCTAWTWNKDKSIDADQTCYLKTDCDQHAAKKGVVSGKMKSEEKTVVV